MAALSSLESLIGGQPLELTGFSQDEREILQAPYALAVRVLGHTAEEILAAVRSLTKQGLCVGSDLVVKEIERLKSKAAVNSAAKNVSVNEDLGSDGESDCCKVKKAVVGGFPGERSPQLELCPAVTGAKDVSVDFSQLVASSSSPQRDRSPMLRGAKDVRLEFIQSVTSSSSSKSEPGSGREPRDVLGLKRRVNVLRSENRRLKERQLCKNCRVKPVSVTFLPCGHYSFCYDCGELFKACPLCQKTILADVKTFLA